MPIMRNARSAFSMADGSGMVYFGLFRKPFGAPSWAMALSMPWEIAARMPPAASFDDTASSGPAAIAANGARESNAANEATTTSAAAPRRRTQSQLAATPTMEISRHNFGR